MKHRDVYIEPLYDEDIDRHFASTVYRPRHLAGPLDERAHDVDTGVSHVAYSVGREGHVRMVEDDYGPIMHGYLQ